MQLFACQNWLLHLPWYVFSLPQNDFISSMRVIFDRLYFTQSISSVKKPVGEELFFTATQNIFFKEDTMSLESQKIRGKLHGSWKKLLTMAKLLKNSECKVEKQNDSEWGFGSFGQSGLMWNYRGSEKQWGLKHHQQFPLVLRYYNGAIQECFLHFDSAVGQDATARLHGNSTQIGKLWPGIKKQPCRPSTWLCCHHEG